MTIPIQNPRLVQLIRDGFSIVGRSRFELDEVVSPVAVVGDLTQAARERQYGAGERTSAPGVGAADTVAHQIENPEGSGVIARIRRISIVQEGGAARRITIRLAQNQLNTLVTRGAAFDQRTGGESQARLRSQTNFPVGVPILLLHNVNANRQYQWDLDVLLGEGDNIVAAGFMSDGELFSTAWQWSEFPAAETRLI